MSKVLVTGGSGFVGSHVIVKLLKEGHEVRTTVRNPNREADVRAMIAKGGVDSLNDLTFYKADLESDAGWEEAMKGCDYVHHVASPFPLVEPKDENEFIRPARDGAIRIMKAASMTGVKRIVLTSSFAAVGYGYGARETLYDETSWTNTDAKEVPAYQKSKTLAERAAWDFIREQKGAPELVVINPVGIFGPALSKDLSSSVEIIEKMMNGEMPGCPDIHFGAVDVRDVADLHVIAMTHPQAAGERFIATACESTSLVEIASILKRELGPAAKRISARKLPNWLVRVFALIKPEVRSALTELSVVRRTTSAKAERVLGWKPRSLEEATIASARSLIDLGVVRD